MPYACTVVAGQPVVTPGPEQGHRIIGPREQRTFTACSPVNSSMCRHWTLHRFDLDCNGARVSWVSVVAATNEGSRRAWLLNGRLALRMGPWWSLSPDDPCAREAGPEERFAPARMRRYCADRLALAPPPIVEMPYGFAPMLGIDGIFVKPGAGAPSQSPMASAETPEHGAAPEQPLHAPGGELPPLRAEPSRELPAAREAPARAPSAAPAPVAVPPPQPAPKVAAPAPPAASPPAAESPKVVSEGRPPAKVAVSPPPPAPASPQPARAASPPSTATSEAPKSHPAEAKPAAQGPNLGPKVVAVVPPPPKEAARPQQPATPAEPESGAPADGTFNMFRATTTGAVVAFAGLALGLLAAFALARSRERQRDAGRRRRDIAGMSLDGKRGKPPARIANAQGQRPPNAAAPAAARPPAQNAAGGAMTEWGDRMPRNRTEALQVLGMGVAPGATEAAIKAIVDGLRRSWHPDLAKDEPDRVMRELRSKQINAAWELLKSQRAEVI